MTPSHPVTSYAASAEGPGLGASSARVAPMRDLAPSAVEALRVHRLRQAEERLAAGSSWKNVSDLVFTNAEGEPLHPNTVRWVLAQGIAAAGVLPYPFQSFRRFAATVVAATGDMKAAQALLGHTSANLTADVYASITDASMQRAADAMEAAMGR